MKIIFLLILSFSLNSCELKYNVKSEAASLNRSYYDLEESGVKSGGVKIIPIENGKYKVWTKRIGNNPKIKVLLLHGGPGCTHEYFESFESFFPKEGIEFYYYDQLGSAYSDQPKDTSLWNLPRFVEEVEQVRKALNLNKDNFYLLGHSWGGILAAQYALKYQEHLKGLIISNMMMSATAYDHYAENVLAKQMDPKVLMEVRAIEANGDFTNPRYMELLLSNFYVKHILRIPIEHWPDAVNRNFNKLNATIYTTMQGPSEFGISGNLENWDITKELSTIEVPTLVIGSTFDTMDPDHMKWVSTQLKNGSFLLCPKGSHMSMWDDQEHYFPGLISWLNNSSK
ncbi:MAG: proline iminopeptidase-family hydrolase [Saprospiraceae bacterium]|nr:proline iminopeptidase-family hydrolase [Saprospiraceae bacterium]MBK9223148.1 proline iminopeptidase-family hydrolase [Saprospiraceae bacterium]MBK9720678.1 proline iminopeptidase-family hydrolase [Saprospiraceae bacterium]MBK9727667.1 proline iminopeptidase-family hydrolase [Saprospiraceae bacterium]